MKGTVIWNEQARNRHRVAGQIGRIWDVPIVKRRMDRLVANIDHDTHVLEVGAGDRNYGKELQKKIPGLYYKSLDIDKNTKQDYYSLSEVDEEFDFVFMFEVIEHMELLYALKFLQELRSKIRSGGKILLSTPNLYHPHQYFGDSTHITFLTFEDLGGLMMTAGFKSIRAFRIYNDAFLRRIFRIYVGIYIHKYFDLDFARAILVEGENP
jgi:SAM-dependent methyltransferase